MALEERLFRGVWWPAGFGCAAMVAAAIMLTVLLARLEAQIEPAREQLNSLVRVQNVAFDVEREFEEQLLAGEPAPDDAWKNLRRVLTSAMGTDLGSEFDALSTLQRLAESNSPVSKDALANLARARAALARSVIADHEALNRLYEQTHPRLLFSLGLAIGISGIATSVAFRWRKGILKPLGTLARELSNLERGRPLWTPRASDQHALQPLFVSCERIAARVDALEGRSRRAEPSRSTRQR